MKSNLLRTPLHLAFATAAVFGLAACEDATDVDEGEDSTVAVRAYIDMDADGEFTEGLDETIVDATVTLTPSEGGTALEETTDDAGLATFTDVEPGTYTAGIAEGAAPDDAELISQPAPTIVAPTEGDDLTAEFRFAYNFNTIASAKELEQGSPVFIFGVVTAGQGTFRDDNLYLQDATSGTQVFGLDPELELTAGTAVRMRGEVGAFSGEIQIVNPSDVVVVGTAPVPAPVELTGTEIDARTHEGELAVVREARVLAVGGGSNYNVTFTAADGETFAARMEGTASSEFTQDDWEVGAGYDLTGVLGSFGGSAQIKPRSADDIERVSDPIDEPDPDVVSIVEARALEDDTPVAVEGVVTVGTGMHRVQGDNIYVQDETGGLQVFGVGPELEIGDSVRIVGFMDTFHERQIASPDIEVLGTGEVPDPVVLGADAFNTLDHEGELVTVEGVTVVEVGETDDLGRYNLTVEDDEGEMSIRIEEGVADVFPPEFWDTTTTYTITGALGQFSGLAQLKPRMESDVSDEG